MTVSISFNAGADASPILPIEVRDSPKKGTISFTLLQQKGEEEAQLCIESQFFGFSVEAGGIEKEGASMQEQENGLEAGSQGEDNRENPFSLWGGVSNSAFGATRTTTVAIHSPQFLEVVDEVLAEHGVYSLVSDAVRTHLSEMIRPDNKVTCRSFSFY